MGLTLYRRHCKECEAGYPEDLRSREFDETRRGWKKGGCLIHVSGTLGGKFKRKQTAFRTNGYRVIQRASSEPATVRGGCARQRVLGLHSFLTSRLPTLLEPVCFLVPRASLESRAREDPWQGGRKNPQYK